MSIKASFLVNGKPDLALSPLDRGFSYGDGVFRTLKVRQGVPEHWPAHYAKLLEDCNWLSIVCPNADVLLADIAQLFTDEPLAVAKIIITRGEGARSYALPALAQPTRVVIKSAMPDYPASYFSEGVTLHLCKLRLPHQPSLAGVKHLNRLENVLARMEWNSPAIFDGLLLDSEGHAIECTMSNLFARVGKKLLTPDLRQCGVAGVTRQRVLDLAQNLGLATEICPIPLAQLLQADELIVCNSLCGVLQVTKLEQHRWQPQNLAQELRQLLQEQ